VRKISPPPGFEPWTVYLVARQHTDYTTLPHSIIRTTIKKLIITNVSVSREDSKAGELISLHSMPAITCIKNKETSYYHVFFSQKNFHNPQYEARPSSFLQVCEKNLLILFVALEVNEGGLLDFNFTVEPPA
jgi:hypothetical protein